jgi:hypothetical protein
MSRSRSLVLSAGLVVLGLAPAAAAQSPSPGPDADAVRVTLSSPVAGTGTRVSVEVDGSRLALPAGASPSGFALLVQQGFRADTSAVARRCAPEEAERFACPAASKVAAGTATAAVTFFGITREVVVDIEGYLAPAVRPGDIAGIAVSAEAKDLDQRFTTTGRLVRAAAPDGLALRFDDLAGGAQVPAGVSIALRSVSLTAGVARTVTVRRTVTRRTKVKRRVRGKDGRVRTRTVTVSRRVKVTRRERRHLVSTPSSCTGTWSARAIVSFAGGGEVAVPATVPCRATRR